MQKIKMEGIRLLESITFLISGFLFTYYVLSSIYKDVGGKEVAEEAEVYRNLVHPLQIKAPEIMGLFN